VFPVPARIFAAVLLLGSASIALSDTPARDAAVTAVRPPSILLLLTDDQRWDTMWAMPTVRERIGEHGMTFSRAYVTNPSCCPSRTSLLTGRYSHGTGVWANDGAYGGFGAFDDASTIATWLDDAGYRTGLFGKYLNGYDPASGYVPPGWDAWLAGADEYYYDYTLLDAHDGLQHVTTYGRAPSDYSTRVLTRRARSFLSGTPLETPFFAVVAYHAPHPPATPAPHDTDAFSELAPHRPPSFDETDVSDKPRYVSRRPPLGPAAELALDALRRDQLRTLRAVDRSVDRLLSALRAQGRLRDTLIVFTSDNGFQWGEHRWIGKGVPYEESIRVPMMVRFDPAGARPGSVSDRLVLGIDLAPTIAELAGVSAPLVEGTSFTALLGDPSAPFRDRFLVEHRAEHPGRATFCAVRLGRWTFVRYYVGEVASETELYDLGTDPYQLHNLAGSPAHADARAMLEAEADASCVPPPT
jgi:arylsulfatase A-like enzyme